MLLYAIQNLPASAGIFISVLMVLCSVLAHYILTRPAKPVSVNYHFTRKCNKTCGFCFHTEKTSHVATWEEIQRGLDLPKEAGMKKINFAGGELFLYPKRLADLVRSCKVDLGLQSVSIISNGTMVTERWIQQHSKYVDVLGISCDSFDESVNEKIGRGTGDNKGQLFNIRGWCNAAKIKFKLSTVVCSYNWQEDMASTVKELNPSSWKCFQVLAVSGENDGKAADPALNKRRADAKKFLITDEQFKTFCDKHKHLSCFVPESNELMASSYLILDEYLRFLDKGDGDEKASRSILDVGVAKALEEVRWDEAAFRTRGGVYEWSKDAASGGDGCGNKLPDDLTW